MLVPLKADDIIFRRALRGEGSDAAIASAFNSVFSNSSNSQLPLESGALGNVFIAPISFAIDGAY